MFLTITLTLLGSFLSCAKHAYGTSSCPRGMIVDTFDNLQAASALTPEAAAPVPQPYNGLKHGQVNVNAITTGNLQPKSSPNVVGLFATDDVLSGQTTTSPFFTISALPNVNGGAKSFALTEFYFGCLIPAFQSAANVAGACTIAVTGLKSNGQMAGELDFSFGNTVATAKNQMVRANVLQASLLGDYLDLKEVNITLIDATGSAAVGVSLVDNVKHINNC